jgi:hypothetical protein
MSDSLRQQVDELWPELDWIESPELKEQVTQTWIRAFEQSPLEPDDLHNIPFTLLVPNCPATFMEHKRCVVHIARDGAKAMQSFLGQALRIDMDTVIAGAILADVGKLLEYEKEGGVTRQSDGVPDQVCHIIATHAAEGDLVKRSTEAFIVHHADFMSFLPFKNLA